MPRIASRISRTAPKSFGMYAKAAALGDTGRDLIHLELGKPAHDTPLHIKEATIAALRAGHVHYGDLRGEPALRAALARQLRESNGIPVEADAILVTNGLTHASFAAIMATVDDGDEVIVLDPHYPQHVGKIELAGGCVVHVPTDPDDGFRIRPERIAAAITARTKMIVMVNPCNPTGRVYSREELEGVAALAIKHDLFVLSDEVYEHILFDGHRHLSIASLPGMAERTISTFAFTKAYAMDGWRLGYVAADASLMPALTKITANDVTHVNTFIQYGALAAIEGGLACVSAMVDSDRRKRDLVVSALNQMPGVQCALPEGTIYAFADVRGTGRGSQALADLLLEQAGVVVESGAFYGQAGEGFLRVCFGSQEEDRLEEAMRRMARLFNQLGT